MSRRRIHPGLRGLRVRRGLSPCVSADTVILLPGTFTTQQARREAQTATVKATCDNKLASAARARDMRLKSEAQRCYAEVERAKQVSKMNKEKVNLGRGAGCLYSVEHACYCVVLMRQQPWPHTRTRTCTRTHAHTRTRTHVRTHIHSLHALSQHALQSMQLRDRQFRRISASIERRCGKGHTGVTMFIVAKFTSSSVPKCLACLAAVSVDLSNLPCLPGALCHIPMVNAHGSNRHARTRRTSLQSKGESSDSAQGRKKAAFVIQSWWRLQRLKPVVAEFRAIELYVGFPLFALLLSTPLSPLVVFSSHCTSDGTFSTHPFVLGGFHIEAT